MSDVHETPAAAAPTEVEPLKAEETKPAELSGQEAATEPIVEPIAASTEESKAGGVTALPTTETSAIEPSADSEPTSTESPVAETKVDEPVSSGTLGYKAPGLIKSFKFSKRFFWLGDEPVSTQHLSHYLRGEKPEVAHPVAAWSSQTGKGLLYFVKHEAEKKTPSGVLHLADASDLEKQTPHEFHFKIHGQKHTFKAANDAERDGWYSALEKAIPEAKTSKEGILSSEGYKESIGHLGKPAALAGGVAAGTAATTKTTEPKAVEPETTATATDAATAEPVARSASSSSSDDAAAAAKKKQSRSVSRSKRTSIFGSLLGKKEEHDAKKEVKKEEKAEVKEEKKEEKAEAKAEKKEEKAEAKEEKKEEKAEAKGEPIAETAAVASAPLDAHAVAERATTDAEPSTTTEAAPVAAPTSETPKDAAATAPKSKRGSIFGSFFEKVRSPTHEKKESEAFAPAVPPKDEPISSEAPRLPEPSTEETDAPLTAAEPTEAAQEPTVAQPEESAVEAAAPVTETAAPAATTTPKAEPTPKKEKESFLGGLISKARAKSPAASKRTTPATTATEAPSVPPKNDEPVEAVKAEEPAAPVAPVAPATTEAAAPAATETEQPTADIASKATSPKESRRKSYFGSLGGAKKSDGETSESEKPLSKITNIFRRPSQATHTKEAKKDASVPEKIEEPAETTASSEPEAAKAAEVPTSETTATEAEKEQQSIGDVVPDAVTVGRPQHESTPTVSATA